MVKHFTVTFTCASGCTFGTLLKYSQFSCEGSGLTQGVWVSPFLQGVIGLGCLAVTLLGWGLVESHPGACGPQRADAQHVLGDRSLADHPTCFGHGPEEQ